MPGSLRSTKRAVTRSLRMRCAVDGCRPVRADSSFRLTGSGCAARASSKDTMRSITWIAVLPGSTAFERGRGIELAESQCCDADRYITKRKGCHSGSARERPGAFTDHGRPAIDEAGVQLDEGCAGFNLGARIRALEDAAHADDRVAG